MTGTTPRQDEHKDGCPCFWQAPRNYDLAYCSCGTRDRSITESGQTGSQARDSGSDSAGGPR